MTRIVKTLGKDVSIFVDSSILNDWLFTLSYFLDLLKATIEKINLEVKGPFGHITIKVPQIGVVVYIFIFSMPAKLLSQKLC